MNAKASGQESSFTDYQALRDKWEHEDNRINHRLSWLIMTQTILFAAYGLMLAAKVENEKSLYIEGISRVINIFPAIGVAVSALIFVGVVGTVGAMLEIRKQRTVQGGEKDIAAARWTSFLGQGTGLFMPLAFISGWAYLFFA